MTIRLRYHLALLPLFLGLTSASVGLYWLVQQRQLNWGHNEAAEGRALVLATFLPPLTDIASPPTLDSVLQRAISRYAKSIDGLSVYWFVLEGNIWQKIPILVSPDDLPPPAPGGRVLEKLLGGSPSSEFVRRPGSASDLSIGYAPLGSARNTRHTFIVACARDVSFRAEQINFLHTSIPFACAVMLVGFFITELLVRRARNDIAELTAGVRALSSGDYNHIWRKSHVHELADLGATLQSIGIILQDRLRRTRLRFLRTEQIPNDEELAKAYREHCMNTPAERPDGNVQYVIRQIGVTHDDFWGINRTHGIWHCVTGRLRKTQEELSALERSLRSHTARDYLLGLVNFLPAQKAWLEMQAVFPLEHGASISFDENEDILSTHIHNTQSHDALLAPGMPAVAGTLSPKSLQLVSEHLGQFPQRPLEALADDLQDLLAAHDQGVVIIFKIAATPAQYPKASLALVDV